ncbi:MAG TPA: metalloregulator ArsR/SmtB family transcription factor [Symbiobacteriaceae bacterium]|nr:metalloregulator ArsR/SmtB family transcription factor [Symbiobacteriaceae bacterium]
MLVAMDKVALALSDPIRLRILDLLAAGRNEGCCSPPNDEVPAGLCSCDILPVLDLAPSRLSYHTAQLKEAGLIDERRRGRWVYYSLNRQTIQEFRQALEGRFLTQPAGPSAGACCLPDSLIAHKNIGAIP